jgi:hypothetical protein
MPVGRPDGSAWLNEVRIDIETILTITSQVKGNNIELIN